MPSCRQGCRTHLSEIPPGLQLGFLHLSDHPDIHFHRISHNSICRSHRLSLPVLHSDIVPDSSAVQHRSGYALLYLCKILKQRKDRGFITANHSLRSFFWMYRKMTNPVAEGFVIFYCSYRIIIHYLYCFDSDIYLQIIRTKTFFLLSVHDK